MRVERDSRLARHRHRQPVRQEREVVDHNASSIKILIPPFQGKNDPDIYIEWERNVEHVFNCHNYSKEEKVKLAVVVFAYFAIFCFIIRVEIMKSQLTIGIIWMLS